MNVAGLAAIMLIAIAVVDRETDNDAARDMLQQFGIDVRDSDTAVDLKRGKSMVVDEHAFAESLNWTEVNFTGTPSAYEVAATVDCFEADWAREDFE